MILVNGRDAEMVSVLDRGFQYGDGVFTTLRVERGIAVFLDRHLDRLRRDTAQLGIAMPSRETLVEEATHLSKRLGRGVLKIMLTRGVGGRGYRSDSDFATTRVLSTHAAPDYPKNFMVDGVSVRICATRLGQNSALAGTKHLNRLENILARREWGDEVQEGLMLDQNDCVIEGTMSNVFVKLKDGLFTPRLDQCGVRGVMREAVRNYANSRGTCIDERDITFDQLMQAEEVFLTNSVIGIWPVRKLGDKVLSSIETGSFFMRGIETLTSLAVEKP